MLIITMVWCVMCVLCKLPSSLHIYKALWFKCWGYSTLSLRDTDLKLLITIV